MDEQTEVVLSTDLDRKDIINFAETHSQEQIQTFLNTFFAQYPSVKELKTFIEDNYEWIGNLASAVDFNGDIFASKKTSGSVMVFDALTNAHPGEVHAVVNSLVSAEFKMMSDVNKPMADFLRKDSVAKAGIGKEMAGYFSKKDLNTYLRNPVKFLKTVDEILSNQTLEQLFGKNLEVYQAMINDESVGKEKTADVVLFNIDTAMAQKIKLESKNDKEIVKKTEKQRDNAGKFDNEDSKEFKAREKASAKISDRVEKFVQHKKQLPMFTTTKLEKQEMSRESTKDSTQNSNFEVKKN